MIERRPEFTVIAGPNGAGKSRLCPFYISTPSFDGDKLMLALRRLHLHLFENITFVDGNSDYGHIVALHITKGNIHKVEDTPPLWFKEQFADAFDKLAERMEDNIE